MDKETKIACKIFHDAGKEFWDDEEWDGLDSDIDTHQVALYAIKKLLKDKNKKVGQVVEQDGIKRRKLN